jgi:hypothetical protein
VFHVSQGDHEVGRALFGQHVTRELHGLTMF